MKQRSLVQISLSFSLVWTCKKKKKKKKTYIYMKLATAHQNLKCVLVTLTSRDPNDVYTICASQRTITCASTMLDAK
jgi:hypothetical protein